MAVAGALPVLALTNIQLPVMDGIAATRHIVLSMSVGFGGHPLWSSQLMDFAKEMQQCLDAGMDHLLAKPLQLEASRMALVRWILRPCNRW